ERTLTRTPRLFRFILLLRFIFSLTRKRLYDMLALSDILIASFSDALSLMNKMNQMRWCVCKNFLYSNRWNLHIYRYVIKCNNHINRFRKKAGETNAGTAGL